MVWLTNGTVGVVCGGWINLLVDGRVGDCFDGWG